MGVRVETSAGRMKYLGLPIALLVLAVIVSLPTPTGLTYQGKISGAIFLMALCLWVSESIPPYATALITIVMVVLTGSWGEANVLGVFGYDVIWLMLAAFIITSGMERTGVAKRLALELISRLGRTAKSVLFVMILVNFMLSFVVPSTTARAALTLPIVLLLAETYRARRGESNFGKLLMIQELQANNISTSAILTATAPQIMAVGYLKDLAGVSVSWGQWLIASLPVAAATMIASYFIGMVIFPPEVSQPREGGMDQLRRELDEMGPLRADEKKAIALFCLTVFLWATGPYHVAMFGVKISLVMVAVLAATLFYMPFIGVLNWKESSIPWDLMVFSCGAYAVGMTLEKSGAASYVLSKIFNGDALKSMSFTVIYALVTFIAIFSHMVFTSKTVRTAILIPTVIGLARAMGVNPIVLALPVAFTIADSITLPPNCKPNLIFYSTGYFSVLDQLKYGVLTLLAKWLLLIVASITWFKVVGIS